MDKLVAMAASTICAAGLMISACAARTEPVRPAGGSAAGSPPPPPTGAAGALLDARSSDAASLQSRFTATVGDRVFFEFDRFTLTQEARACLARQAAWLSLHSQLAVVIAGHRDSREARDDAADLAARRTDTVFDYLSAHGMAFRRIRKVSYGADRPLDAGTSPAALARNRSAQVILIDLNSR